MQLLWEHRFEGAESLQLITDQVDGIEVPMICMNKVVGGKLRCAKVALFDTDREKDLVPEIYSQLGRWIKAKQEREEAIKQQTEEWKNQQKKKDEENKETK